MLGSLLESRLFKHKNQEQRKKGFRCQGAKIANGKDRKMQMQNKSNLQEKQNGLRDKQTKFCLRRQFQAFFSVHQMQTISPGKSLKMEREQSNLQGKKALSEKVQKYTKKCRTKFNHSKICKMPQNANKIHLHIYPPKNAVTGKKKFGNQLERK